MIRPAWIVGEGGRDVNMMEQSDPRASPGEPRPLSSLGCVPPSAVAKLAERWITTAEEFLAAASLPSARRELAQYLAMEEGKIEALAKLVEEAVPRSGIRLRGQAGPPGGLGLRVR